MISYGVDIKIVVGSLLIEGKEEEKCRGPFTGDALGFADAGSGAVAHGTVTFDLADAGTGAVTHGAVAFNSAHAGT